MKGLELASVVSTKEPYFFGDEKATYKVAALDLGIKTNILRCLAERDCYIKVFPYNATFEELKAFNPDGYFLSNGPGDPEPLKGVQEVARQIIATDKPVFGICLGHQTLALANGISTYKMFNGHRGINHPVNERNHESRRNHVPKSRICRKPGRTGTTSGLRNHPFTLKRRYRSQNAMKNKAVFSVQYHPEASPGPHDARYLFDDFVTNIKAAKN